MRIVRCYICWVFYLVSLLPLLGNYHHRLPFVLFQGSEVPIRWIQVDRSAIVSSLKPRCFN